MISFVRRLQKKPEHKRRRWLLLSTLSIMFVVVLMWAFMFQYEFGTSTAVSEKTQNVASPISTFQQIFENAKDSANVLKNSDTYNSTDPSPIIVEPVPAETAPAPDTSN